MPGRAPSGSRRVGVLDERVGGLLARPDILFFDRPTGRLVGARHAPQRESARLGVQEEIVTAEAADETAQAGRESCHEVVHEILLLSGTPVQLGGLPEQAECQLIVEPSQPHEGNDESRVAVLVSKTLKR